MYKRDCIFCGKTEAVKIDTGHYENDENYRVTQNVEVRVYYCRNCNKIFGSEW